ncbi:hypothetical protein GIB67_037714 [Kingdonia uniflora]|nr:hypothetical protein GIB67_037714 [Kingdonia uniflora]
MRPFGGNPSLCIVKMWMTSDTKVSNNEEDDWETLKRRKKHKNDKRDSSHSFEMLESVNEVPMMELKNASLLHLFWTMRLTSDMSFG